MNRLLAARPLLRSIAQPNLAAVQQRLSSHGHYEDIGPKASYNQLPQPEGDWQQHHDKKQQKYNAILLGSALFFAGTFVFMKQSGIIFFNAYPPDTYE